MIIFSVNVYLIYCSFFLFLQFLKMNEILFMILLRIFPVLLFCRKKTRLLIFSNRVIMFFYIDLFTVRYFSV